MLEMLEMEFMQRVWLAGLIMAVICPLIGSFLVLRRQSLIGDGLGHIAFAGVAGGALWGYSPVLSAAAATILGALAIEKVRTKLSDAADMVLAIFFYSGMGLAVIFTGLNKDGGFNLGSILFGSLMMVGSKDLMIVAALGFFTVLFVVLFYRPLQYLTFDEKSAKVAGLPVERLNLLLAMLTALTVALSMRIGSAFGFCHDGNSCSLRTANGAQLSRDDFAKHALWCNHCFFRLNYFLLYKPSSRWYDCAHWHSALFAELCFRQQAQGAAACAGALPLPYLRGRG